MQMRKHMHRRINAMPRATNKTQRICVVRSPLVAKVRACGTRCWSFMYLVMVAALLCDVKTTAMHERAEDRVGERRNVVLRGLMPITDGNLLNVSNDYRLYYQSYGNDNEMNSDSKRKSSTAIIALSVGVALLLIAVCLTWRACVECCTRSSRRSRHRAFIERPNASWQCAICYHANELFHTECVLCGTRIEEIKKLTSPTNGANTPLVVASQAETSVDLTSSYLLMSSPRLAWIRDLTASADPGVNPSVDLSDRQLVARERHQWKRCIGTNRVRWVNVPINALLDGEALRSTIIRESDFQKWQKQHPPPTFKSSETSLPFVIFPDSGEQQLSGFTPRRRRAERWRSAAEFSVSSRQYSKMLVRVAASTFSEKAQWFYQYSLKLSSSIVEEFYTIQIHRNRVLQQSMTHFMSVPNSVLHRRLRVDFRNEVGIDGGGISREWLHLVCNQLFAEDLGLFKPTNSTSHQGYWINRSTTKKPTKQLKMYIFFGKILGKALLEGLFLNVRLSIPLLKHILGVPLKSSDLYLLDETVHSSVMWILENDNTNALGLNFTVEGTELIPSGASVSLHDGNKQLYVAKVVQYYLFDSVRAEISSIMEGVQSVISDPILHVFDFKELDLLLSGLPQIDVDDWRQHTDVRFYEENDHEFDLINWFWDIVESFTQDQRGRLLQYVTGSSSVPVDGFKGLTGMDGKIQLFTIQLGKDVSTVYTVLPHASTCMNRLDLPLYSSKAELERILTLVHSCFGGEYLQIVELTRFNNVVSQVIDMDVTGFNSR